jgi:D-3-phosphoglycerate dehydrogenase
LAFYAADSISTENSHETSTLLHDDFKDKTLFTPHLGAQTIEAIDLMGSMAVENVLAVLAGKPVRNQVI